jgi:hypothetical protein
MADRDLTITARTADQISALDQHQLEMTFTGGSMDFSYDPGLDVGAADTVYTIGNLDSIDLSSGIDWSTLNSNITLGPLMSDTIANTMQMAQSGRLTLTGDDADIEINGESVMSVLREIRDRLGIIQVSEAMEAEWDELRELRQQYEAKLAECREKSEAWNALKQMPPPQMP